MKRDLRTIVFITRPLAVLRGLAKKPHPCYSVTPPLLKERGPGGEVKVTGVGLLLALALALPQLGLAQTYEIPAGVVASGGGTATSASYSLSGTVGQPAADIGLSSTSYNHDGGFWPQAQALTVPQVLLANTGSAYYDGINDYIRVLDGNPVDPANANPGAYQITGNQITVEAWVFPMRLPGQGNRFWIVERPYFTGEPWRSYALAINNLGATDDPRFSFEVSDGVEDPVNDAVALDPNPVPLGQWVHLAGTYDGTYVRLYVNGDLAIQVSYTGSLSTGDAGFYTGLGYPERGSSCFHGLIDEVRLWNVTRSQTDVQAGMNVTLYGNEANLAGYWPFNSDTTIAGVSDVTPDLTPNNNHLYVRGGAYFTSYTPGDAVSIPAFLVAQEFYGVVGEPAYGPLAGGWPQPTVTLISGPEGLTIDPATNLINWTPQPGQEGYHTFTLKADNSAGSSGPTTFSIWVDQFAVNFAEHDNNNTRLSVFNDGTVGTDYIRRMGNGFAYTGDYALYEGSLIIAADGGRISTSVYGDEDFATRSDVFPISSNLSGFTQAYQSEFDDSRSGDPIGISVVQKSHSKVTAPDDDYTILTYEVTNTSGAALSDVRIGLFMDWDVGNASNNLGGYDDSRDLIYTYDATSPVQNDKYYGTVVLQGQRAGRSVGNIGYGDTDLLSLLNVLGDTPTAPEDMRSIQVIDVGSIPYGGRVQVAFAVLGGNDLKDLQDNADAARAAFNLPTVAPVVTLISPNGGEVWNEDAYHAIWWEATDDDSISRIQLFYSVDEGAYTLIADSVFNDGVRGWFVPRTPTDRALVKVIATDITGLTTADSSDSFFTIQDVETYIHNTGAVAHTMRNDGRSGSFPGSLEFDPPEPSMEFPVGTGNDHLYTGQLVLLGKNSVPDTVGIRINYRENFSPLEPIVSTVHSDYVETVTRYEDIYGLGFQVSERTLAKTGESAVIQVYTVHNTGEETYSDLYVGQLGDFDINDPKQNLSGYDSDRGLAYMYDPTEGGWTSYAGFRLLDQSPVAFRRNPPWSLEGLYESLSKHDFDDTAQDTSGEYRVVESIGPFNLAPGDSFTVAFALVAGAGQSGLFAAADRAQVFWDEVSAMPSVAITGLPTGISATGATLTGIVNPKGQSTDVSFEWWDETAPSDIKTIAASPSPVTDDVNVAVSAAISGLTAGGTYHYRAVATNAGGTTEGDDQVFTTPADENTIVDNRVIPGSGTVRFWSTNLFMNFNFTNQTGEDVVRVSRVETSPTGTLPSDVGLVASRYWIIEHLGSSTFDVAMTFVLWTDAISGDDQTAPGNLRLLRRDTGSDGPWTEVVSGTSANDSSVTFASITGFSEFTIGSTSLAVDTEAPHIEYISDYPAMPVLQEIIVIANVTDNNEVGQVWLHHCPAGAIDYTVEEMPLQSQWGEYRLTLSYGMPLHGLVFFVRAVDVAQNADTSAVHFVYAEMPDRSLSTNLADCPYAGGFPKDRWRLISIPAYLHNKSVEANIGDKLGGSSDSTWKIFAYTGNNENPWMTPSNFLSGDAYWLNQRVEDNIQFFAVSATNNDLEEFSIVVKPGWNLIGAPYTFSSPIELDPQTFYGPITFTGSDTALTGWTGTVNELAPWGGYAVYNRTSSDQTITLSAEPGGGLGKDLLAKEIDEQPEGWLLQLQAEGKTYADVANAVGRLEGATEQLDYFDNPEPPYIDGFVSLAMERPDWGANLPRFTSDIRSIEENDGVWDLELFVKGEKGPITLSHALQGDLPTGNRIILLDVMTREVHDLLADDGPLTFTRYREDFPYHLKVVAGSASYVEFTTKEILASLPSDFSLAQNYPNPFNPTTHLRYSLFQPARVTLNIYNLLGQEVVTLFDGWQDLGHYEVVWEGRDRFGVQVASGIYFAAYMAEGRLFTRKMLLLK